jgi:hypothetical protein
MSWDKCSIFKYGASHRFTRLAETGDHDQQGALIAEAIDVIAPLFEPLAIEVDLGCLNRELLYLGPDLPDRNSFHIRVPNLPQHVGLAPMYEGPILEVPTIDGTAIKSWLPKALEEPCTEAGPSFRTTWQRMLFLACRGRLHGGSGETFLLESANDRIPVETRKDGSSWISGPLDLPGWRLAVPCKVEFRQDTIKGAVDLDLSVFWSIWQDEGSPSARVFDELKQKIVALGWEKKPIL